MKSTARKGLTQSIVAILKTGDKTHDELLALLPLYTARQVTNCLNVASTRGRYGVTAAGPTSRKVYGLSPVKPARLLPVIAPVKPLKHDLFANWRLCERAPFDPARDVRALVR